MTRSGTRNDDLVPWLSMVHFFFGFPCPTFLTLRPVCRPSQCSPQIMFNSPPAPLRLTSPYVIPLSALCFRLALIKPTPQRGLKLTQAWHPALHETVSCSFCNCSCPLLCSVVRIWKTLHSPINFWLATFNHHKSKTKNQTPYWKNKQASKRIK